MIHIYTGDGKGKTTAALGLLIRAAGSGKKCGYLGFLKDGSSSEISVLKKIPNITVFDFPDSVGFTWLMSDGEKREISEFYRRELEKIKNTDLGLLVLDEALDAVSQGLIEENKISELSKKCELIITGRGSCERLFQKADYITIMKKERHPFDKGVCARKGIEY